jgi:hypothetical protein
MYYSFQEQRKRELTAYRKKLEYLGSLDNDEINSEYINLKSTYERKKIFLSIFMLSLVISVLMDMWKSFYYVIRNLTEIASSFQENSIEILELGVVLFLILFGFVTVIVLISLFIYINGICEIYKNLLIVEEIRNKKMIMRGNIYK